METEDHAVVTYDEVESNYKPTNNIARDFEEQRVVPTEDNEPEQDDEFFDTGEEESKDGEDDNSTMKQAIIDRLKKEMSTNKGEVED